ncbi:GTPase IMAP family member 4 [Megalops cyprinoides]|uniref:GTPase IMAP family member 4 n=1 Tax=Megalops cyprinoides TaxID=118141 RepID=UPI001864805D|nr:GTPase IMAP family member 4 [Megalops cyprinoides]
MFLFRDLSHHSAQHSLPTWEGVREERGREIQEERETMKPVGSCSSPDQNELRLMVVGPRRTGKSSSGNTILGAGAFETWGGAASAVRRGVAPGGRRVAVVDVFGWGDPEEPVPKREKLELMRALSLCDPGPHAVLLVVPLLQFTEPERGAIERRLALLTEGVWRHTMVLFTFGDRLRGDTMEQHLQKEGQALSWLTTRCRNRYHVLNNKASDDQAQVTELLEKIEDMVAENGQWHFSLHMYQRLEEAWRRREENLRRSLNWSNKNRSLPH